jgi:type I restriction enzyme S subunit
MSSKEAGAMSEDNSEKSALVPRLRFPEFREAEEWEVRELGALCRIRTGKKDANEGCENGLYPFFTCAERHIFSNTYSFDAEAILIAGNANVGQAKYYKGKFEAYQRTYVLTDFAQVSVPYLYLYLSAQLSEALARQVQTSAMSYIKLPMLETYKVPSPNAPEEQQKIADCLSSLDDLITAEIQALTALKTHKKGLMQQLFPREGETVPRLRFPEFREAGEWEEKPLAEVCNVLQGYGFPEVLQGRSEGKYPFCKVSDISRAVAERGGLLDEATNYVSDDDLLKLRAKPIPKGATVFAKIGEALRLNRRAYVQRECLIDNNATGLKAIDGVADDYFVYLLSQLINLNEHCGGAVPSVNKTTLEEIKVVVPGLDEQKRIAKSLAPLDDLITAQSQKIDALKSHKKGLMQQLFPVLDEVPA